MSEKKNRLMHTTLAVTLVIFLSKGIGFVREMIMAYYFGSTAVTDAYNAAYSLFYLPVLLFSSCITSTLVPLYIRRSHEQGLESANRFAGNTVNLFALASITVSIIMMLAARPLIHLIYPGFAGETLALTVELTRVMMPALAFFVVAIVLSTVLNAQEHYLAAQLTGFPFSAALITAAVFFSRTVGIRAQAWGIIAAGVLQVAVLIPALTRDYHYYPVFNVRDEHFRRLMVLAVPAVLSMAVNELNHMVDRMLASTLNSGDISAMSYAFKLIMFMMGVIVVPLTTIFFSHLSKTAAAKDHDSLVEQIRSGISLLSSVIFPIVACAAVCATQIIRLAYFRGQFDENSVLVTGSVFLFYVVGVPFFGLRDLMNRVYHSLEDTRTPMIIACISMALNIALNLILRHVMGVNGLAFATTVAAFTGVMLLSTGIEKRLKGVFNREFLIDLAKILLASALGLAAALAVSRLIPAWTDMLRVILWLAIVAGSGIIVYAAACLALGVRQLRRLLTLLKP